MRYDNYFQKLSTSRISFMITIMRMNFKAIKKSTKSQILLHLKFFNVLKTELVIYSVFTYSLNMVFSVSCKLFFLSDKIETTFSLKNYASVSRSYYHHSAFFDKEAKSREFIAVYLQLLFFTFTLN